MLRTHRFFPVVHCVSAETAASSIRVARMARADGAFLIDQGKMLPEEVIDLAKRSAAEDPLFPVGVNILGMKPEDTVRAIDRTKIRMLWTDQVDWGVGQLISNLGANPFLEWFGGVAFKYTQKVPPKQYEAAVKKAFVAGVGAITTSGDATGVPADLNKVAALSTFARRCGARLGLASGVTDDNVDSFLPYVDDFIVGTWLETSFGVLDLDRTHTLCRRIHGLAWAQTPEAQALDLLSRHIDLCGDPASPVPVEPFRDLPDSVLMLLPAQLRKSLLSATTHAGSSGDDL